MQTPSRWVPGLALLAASCGSSSYVADFAVNEILYADVPFQTKAPGDRPVFVTPVADQRDPSVLPSNDRGFPIAYGGDDFWERPVPEMFGDVLTRQLADCGLFSEVSDRAAADGLVLKPTLTVFTNGTAEAVSGSRSFAEIALRLQVFGPVAADGKRPLVHDQTYSNRQVSQTEVKPVNPYRLLGRALQLTMAKALSGLDGSNVARSHVPADSLPAELGLPAEAAAPAR
jgi:hypothetical protein